MVISFILLLSSFLTSFTTNEVDDYSEFTGVLSVKISVLEDVNAYWSIDSVLTNNRQILFDNSPHTNAYLGYKPNPHWFRIEIPETIKSDELVVVISYSGLYEVTFFDGYPNQGREIYQAGRKYPISEWPEKARNLVFTAKHFKDGNALYIRAREDASLIVPIRVMYKENYENSKFIEQLFYGAFLGLVVAMVLYNLMLFIALCDLTYLYYIIAMVANSIVSLVAFGYGKLYFWPENDPLDGQIYLMAAGISIMASSRFVSHFLQFPKTNRLLDQYFWGISILSFIMVVLSFFYSFVELTNYGRFLVLVAIPSYLVIGILSWKRGYKPARFFVLAWIPYISGLVIIVFKGAGLMPYHALIEVSGEIGTSLEAILLSLALADRINTYKKEKAEAEKKSIQAELEKQELIIQNKELDHSLVLKEKDLDHEKQQLAASTLWLTQKNKVLQDIQFLIKKTGKEPLNGHSEDVQKLISQNLNAEDDWVKFKGHFEKVHSGFFTTLRSNYPDLTSNDHRLCAYLRMNMSSKEIAMLLGITVNAIEQARRRMRKRLHISNTEINLINFLQELN